MEVQSGAIRRDAGAFERVEQIVHAARGGHARGVAERQAVGAGVDEMARELGDPLRRDVTFIRTTERGGDDRLGLDVRPVRELDDIAGADERFGHGAADVLLVVRLARADHELELVGPGLDRPLRTLGIRDERGVDDAGPAIDRGHHGFRSGHRRDRRGRDEGGGLDPAQTGARERVDQADPLRNGYGFLVLQSVAGTDLTNLDTRAANQASEQVRCAGRDADACVLFARPERSTDLQVIAARPMLHDLPVSKAEDMNEVPFDRLARRWDSRYQRQGGPLMSSPKCPANDHLVVFGYNVLDLDDEVGKRLADRTPDGLQGLDPRLLVDVIDEVRRHKIGCRPLTVHFHQLDDNLLVLLDGHAFSPGCVASRVASRSQPSPCPIMHSGGD